MSRHYTCFGIIAILFLTLIPFCAHGQNPWETKWTAPLEAAVNAPTLFPDAEHPDSVIVTASKIVQRLRGDGTVAWRIEQPTLVTTPATVADVNEDKGSEVIFGRADGAVVCLDPEGKALWTYQAPTLSTGPRNIVVADLLPSPGKEILFGWDDGWLNCLSSKGTLLWRFYGDKYRVGGIATGDVDGDGAPEVVYGTDNGHLYCISHDGTVKWRYFEDNPYGRSGPNLADLNGDGKIEVLITRSNAGSTTRLIAVDGVTGKLLWRTQDEMQGYYSNAVVDLDGDGKYEVLHADKGNYIYCENADGTRRWQVQVGGRGIFWAPAVADVDGDGHLEIFVGVRDMDLQTKACAYVISDEGKLKASLTLGSNANNAPVVGDINQDNKLEVLFACSGPNQIHCLTWNGTGKVAWPSFRGDSAMTGATKVSVGAPTAPKSFTPSGEAVLDAPKAADWGENTWKLTWKTPVGAEALLELSRVADSGLRETWVAPVKEGATSGEITWLVDSPGKENAVSVRLLEPSKQEVSFVLQRTVSVNPIGTLNPDLETSFNKAIESGRRVHANVSDLVARRAVVQEQAEGLRYDSEKEMDWNTLAMHAIDFQHHSAALVASAQTFTRYWEEGGKQSFVWWHEPNPWGTFDPLAVPERFPDQKAPLHVSAYGDEFEDAVVMLRNITGKPIDLRCTFAKPTFVETAPAKEPDLAKNITLRRGLRVSTQNRGMQIDPLPELDASGVLTLMPGETVPLWLVVNTHGMEAGTHTVPLYLCPLGEKPEVVEVPIEIEVWPIKLPDGVYDQINWIGCSQDITDQALRDMLDHGITVFYGPAVTISVNAEGALAGEPDWKLFDAALARLPGYCKVLFTAGAPALKWPEGVQVKDTDDLYATAFKNGVRAMVKHLDGIGWGYDRWAFYPVDEPWLTGDTQIPFFRRFCTLVKEADPKARMYADPVGEVRINKLEEFTSLVDIWQPEANMLKRSPALEKWFHDNSRTFWIYEAPGPGKDLLPLGHYRAFAWWAWMFGCKGAGYWCYRDGDLWWKREITDYGVVYPAPGGNVVPTVRWEASRDGNEDYRALYLLRAAIDKARAAGKTTEADSAQALIDEAVQFTVGWQRGVIDEITSMTRDYDIDIAKLQVYKKRIADQTVALNGLK